MTAYYNEIDPAAAAWLRELIAWGHIAPGEVDERSIEDVHPSDLRGFAQCHFFAGIGGWSLALRMAGWPDGRPVWTGSCPCQPFSAAGKGAGFSDERHLWPAFHWLIGQCEPPVVFGEQVASKDGLQWLDLVHADLEASGYAVGAADLCAAGVGAPHIRQRLYWVADSNHQGLERRWQPGRGRTVECAAGSGGLVGGLAHAEQHRGGREAPASGHREQEANGPADQHGGHRGAPGRLADTDGRDASAERQQRGGEQRQQPQDGGADQDGPTRPTDGFWRAADWLGCRDGRWRPVEPGTFPLVDGLPRGVVPSSRIGMAIDAQKTAEARVMRLRGYGNAIVPQVAAEFIRSMM